MQLRPEKIGKQFGRGQVPSEDHKAFFATIRLLTDPGLLPRRCPG